MTRLSSVFRQFFITILIFVIACGLPAAAFADASSSADTISTASGAAQTTPAATSVAATSPTTVTQPTNGSASIAASPTPSTVPASQPVSTPPASDDSTNKPTGASAGTYQYNQLAKRWENAHYIWDPAAGLPVPKVAPTYTYNAATKLWDASLWLYDAANADFVLTPTSVVTPPAGALLSGGPGAVQPVTVTPTPATKPVTTTPAAPTPQLDKSTVSNVSLSTTVNSQAQSGNALLQNNNTAGDATSGAASAAATVVNLLQSSTSLGGGNVTMFTKDIQGSDMPGDFVIDPASFLQSASGPTANDLSVRSQTTGTIQNTINLSASSGNATILDNKKAGDATTGSASAVANVMNMINSVVAANQSFVGTINIYGDYSGNILVPTDSLQTLLGDSPSDGTQAGATSLTTDSNQNITNNVDLAATSGNATLLDNKKAGNATTGNALTNLTILNLTGHQVTAANSLLVFINVLGSWVGVIMDAPAGTTTAALTGGQSGDNVTAAPATTSGTDYAYANATDIDDSSSIINNITAHAQSGDAALISNKKAGNATSGSATASANILNIINSSFSLSHWFGVLFINVFGNWHGSVQAAKPALAAGAASTGAAGSNPVQAVRVFGFSQNNGGQQGLGLASITPSSFASSGDYKALVSSVGKVLAAHDVVNKIAQKQAAAGVQHQKHFSLSVLPIALGITGLSAVGAERVRAIRRKFGL